MFFCKINTYRYLRTMKVHTIDLDFLGVQKSIAVFVAEGPDGYALVECGPASTLPRLQQSLSEIGLQMRDFQHVFLSHIHFDHAGAAWAFAKTGARIYVHPKGVPHLAQPEKLYNSARMIYGDQMDRLWGPMYPIAESQLYAPQHGETIRAAGVEFRAWYTPGHAVHHIAWQMGDIVFTGDVGGVRMDQGPVMPPCPPPDIHIEDWQASIRLLREMPASRLFLTHFGEIFDKNVHFDTLETRLLEWATWMRPHAESGTVPEQIVPLFQDYVREELMSAGVPVAGLGRYEAANPAFMSVAGLLRYWKKKMENKA